MAIVSVASIVDELRSGELRIIDIEGCTIRREFSFCWPEGRSDALAARFVEFARHTADPSRRFCEILRVVFGCGIAAGSVRVLENAVVCHRKPLVVYSWLVAVS